MSKIEVNEIVNQSGDNDSGIDLTTNDQIGFKIANASKWTLNSSGNLFPASTSQGIVLGATSDTSANRLEDYEEGSFTPSVTFGGGSTGVTYSSSRRIGKYTKLGNVVEYFVHVELTSKGSSTGAVQITGLPFTVVGDQHYIPGAVFISAMASLASGAPIYRAQTGTTVLDCYEITNSSYSGITNSNYTNSTGVQVSGKYYTS